jgi:hypothetical protein
MDGKYMVNERYSFKLSNYARDLIYSFTEKGIDEFTKLRERCLRF